MTTATLFGSFATRSSAVASQRFAVPKTSSLKEDALLTTRMSQDLAWEVIVDDLLRILPLKDDWDGQGAKAPSHALVFSCLRLAQSILRNICKSNPHQFPWGVVPCRVVPGVTGSVIFEWQQGETHGELEIVRPDIGEFVLFRPGYAPRTAEIEW